MKNAFLFYVNRSFLVCDIQIFELFFPNPFSLFSHCEIYRRGWWKINPKFYDVTIFLNRFLRHLVNCYVYILVVNITNDLTKRILIFVSYLELDVNEFTVKNVVHHWDNNWCKTKLELWENSYYSNLVIPVN